MKKFLFGMAALLSVSLIFLGCPTEADDDDKGDISVDLSNWFSLKNGENAGLDKDTSGLEIASVSKSSSGDVTIVLEGTISPNYQAVVTAGTGKDKSKVNLGAVLSDAAKTDWLRVWGTDTALAGAEPGIYGAAYIANLITDNTIADGPVAIRQTNEALRLYAGVVDLVPVDKKPAAPVVPPTANIWIPGAESTDMPVKWKVYNSMTTDLKAEPFGVLIWNGGPDTKYFSKTATLEIAKAAVSGTGATVESVLLAKYIIDYSRVKFATAADLVAALGAGNAELDTTNKNIVNLKVTDVTIDPEKTIDIVDGITLNVQTGKKLTVAGNLNVAGELKVAGNADVSGKVTVASGGKIVSPALGTDGLPTTTSKITFKDGGTIELAQGAIGYYGNAPFIGPSSADAPYAYNWGTGTDGKVTLKGTYTTELTAGNVIAAKDTGIAALTTISIAKGAKLTIASDVKFAVSGGGNNSKNNGTLDVKGDVVVDSGATLTVAGTINVAGTLDVLGEGGFVVDKGTLKIAGGGQVIENVSDEYKLASTDNSVEKNNAVLGSPSILKATAKKVRTDATSPTVTITLTPTTGQTLLWVEDFKEQSSKDLWGAKPTGKITVNGKWTDIAITLSSVFNDLGNKKVSVRQTNQAFRYYSNAASDLLLLNKPTVAEYDTAKPNTWIPAANNADPLPVKWKGYNQASSLVKGSPGATTYGIILWNEDKTQPPEITLEIYDESGTSSKLVTTIKIDYSELLVQKG
jgi:cytoskeletal protein CcmA (bactofilin family)